MEKIRNLRIGWIAVITVIVPILAVWIGNGTARHRQNMELYEQAVALYDGGSYDEAKELFYDVPDRDFRDTESYIALCRARIAYDNGNIDYAYRLMRFTRFNNLSREQHDAFGEFMAALNAGYEVYLKEKVIADKRAYRDRITNGVPYIGMPESEIRNTSLGAPSGNVRHNTEMKNGQPHSANIYDFKRDKATIFTARCVDGYVINVWDHRDNPVVPYRPEKSTKSYDDDPFNVHDYIHPDDFYYDHYDDFVDYEDAEDYYNEHHK